MPREAGLGHSADDGEAVCDCDCDCEGEAMIEYRSQTLSVMGGSAECAHDS